MYKEEYEYYNYKNIPIRDYVVNPNTIDLSGLNTFKMVVDGLKKYNTLTNKKINYCEYILGKSFEYFFNKFEFDNVQLDEKTLPIILGNFESRGLDYIVAYTYIYKFIIPVFMYNNPNVYNQIRRYGDIVDFFKKLAVDAKFSNSEYFKTTTIRFQIKQTTVDMLSNILKTYYSNNNFKLNIRDVEEHNKRSIVPKSNIIREMILKKDCKIKTCYNTFIGSTKNKLLDIFNEYLKKPNLVYIYSDRIIDNTNIHNIGCALKMNDVNKFIRLDISNCFNSIRYCDLNNPKVEELKQYDLYDKNLCINLPFTFTLFNNYMIEIIKKLLVKHKDCHFLLYVDDIIIGAQDMNKCIEAFKELDNLLSETSLRINIIKIIQYETIEDVKFIGKSLIA